MQIESGKLYTNRTWRYLYPCLGYYGESLMSRINKFLKLGIGLGDPNFSAKKPYLYILLDANLIHSSLEATDKYREDFSNFVTWLRYQKYFVADYIFDMNNQHMIVLELPEKYTYTFKYFTDGLYSQMYNHKDIEDYFKSVVLPSKEIELEINKKLTETRKILRKDPSYLSQFIEKVNSRFFSTPEVSEKDFVDAELDFPPNKEQEYFNFKKELI
jgi:hypothetical protein